jgi:hypothetical protein
MQLSGNLQNGSTEEQQKVPVGAQVPLLQTMPLHCCLLNKWNKEDETVIVFNELNCCFVESTYIVSFKSKDQTNFLGCGSNTVVDELVFTREVTADTSIQKNCM